MGGKHAKMDPVGGLAKRLAPIIVLPALTAGIVLSVRAFAANPAPANPPAAPGQTSQGPVSSSGCTQQNSLIGTVAHHRVAVKAAPSSQAKTVATFRRHNVQGNPQVFLLVGQETADGHSWYRALLPVRPNGTTGFIQSWELKLSQTPYHLSVNKERRRLTLWSRCQKVRTYPVGIGTKFTPTPVGTFYLASLLKPPTNHSVYGVYAYGLSGYSAVIHNWRWGGVIGLHGTDDPSSVGHFTSHGCIRMYNWDITKLVRILPLGTPITIS